MSSYLRAGLICALAFACFASAQDQSGRGVPVSVVVTAEAKRGTEVPQLTRDMIKVTEAGGDREVTNVTRFGAADPLQLLLLIDDSSSTSFDTEIPALKQWINSLPQGTEIGVGYMRNGMAALTSKFTRDHAAAANSIRVTMGPGGADVSPYDSLSDAVKHWPAGDVHRKEVVMISSGIEALGGGVAPENPYVNKGIADAQRAGVVVFTIFNPSVGHLEHTFWRETMGQNFLSQLSDETGGESYITTFTAPVSFTPFLENISRRLQDQYLVAFLARPENKAGLQQMRMRVNGDHVDVAAPDHVFVPASK